MSIYVCSLEKGFYFILYIYTKSRLCCKNWIIYQTIVRNVGPHAIPVWVATLLILVIKKFVVLITRVMAWVRVTIY